MKPRPSFWRFLTVGGLFALLYSAVTAYLVSDLKLPAFATSTLVFALCIPLAFGAHRVFSFQGGQTRKGGFARYAALQVLAFSGVNVATSHLVTGRYWIDGALYLGTVGITAVLTYLAARYLVFTHPAEARQRNVNDVQKRD